MKINEINIFVGEEVENEEQLNAKINRSFKVFYKKQEENKKLKYFNTFALPLLIVFAFFSFIVALIFYVWICFYKENIDLMVSVIFFAIIWFLYLLIMIITFILKKIKLKSVSVQAAIASLKFNAELEINNKNSNYFNEYWVEALLEFYKYLELKLDDEIKLVFNISKNTNEEFISNYMEFYSKSFGESNYFRLRYEIKKI